MYRGFYFISQNRGVTSDVGCRAERRNQSQLWWTRPVDSVGQGNLGTDRQTLVISERDRGLTGVPLGEDLIISKISNFV
jgi:hypothetical protein